MTLLALVGVTLAIDWVLVRSGINWLSLSDQEKAVGELTNLACRSNWALGDIQPEITEALTSTMSRLDVLFRFMRELIDC